MNIEAQIAAFFTEDRAIHATPLTTPECRPSPGEIVEVLMETYDQSSEVIIDWISNSDFSEVK